jgi:undecaprenyl-diphosphatase
MMLLSLAQEVSLRAGTLPLWKAAVLGLVEGITEYLPISSTGHLIIASSLMGLDADPATKRAVDDFNIVIQAGAILAVVGLYRKTVLRMLLGVLGKDGPGFALFVNLIIAFIPAAVIGLLLDDWIEARLFRLGPVLAALLVGGVFMIVLDVWRKGRFSPPKFHTTGTNDVFDLTPKQAAIVGMMQVFAMWPGMSRSMMTITGGVIAGMTAKCAAEFSFLLGVLTLCAASAYKLLKNLLHAHKTDTPNMFETLGVVPVLVGIVIAAISAALAVKWLVGFLTKHGLAPFGWYRIVLAIVLGVLAWQGVVRV